MFFYHVFPTSAGWIGALATAAGLIEISLPQKTETQAHRAFRGKLEKAAHNPDSFHDLAERLKAYFNGRKADFPDKLDLSGATPFQREVWRVTRLIPYGQTRSYRWVATQTGRPGAALAVGQALCNNPLPVIIPCHRVIAANGRLVGYSGGIEIKRRLLELEDKGRGQPLF